MLSWLKIKNYLLIDQLYLDIPKGFITLTGETGAGKSVLLGAISLITGKRADSGVLLNKDLKCVIEAGFNVENLGLLSFFNENDLDYEPETILRREIAGNGKSRAFINDTPVRLDQLQILSKSLIDIHSQHQTLILGQESFQRSILDSVSSLNKELLAYQHIFKKFKSIDKELAQMDLAHHKSLEEKDYLEFQFRQLDDAKLQIGELEELESSEKILSNSDNIKSVLLSLVEYFTNAEPSVIENMNLLEKQLMQIGSNYAKAGEFSKRLETICIDLQDLVDTCEQESDLLENDPVRLIEIQDRLNIINSLLQKHQLQNADELIVLRDSIDDKLSKLQLDDSRLEDLRVQHSLYYNKLLVQAEKLNAKRSIGIPKLEKKLREMLIPLGMPKAQFVIQMNPLKNPSESGMDEIHFLFSANPDLDVQEIHKVASGGEMSRLMLCLKSIIAETLHLPTIVFDEIDTGVSGEVAAKMGTMMKFLSENSQIISITHLPQVAALGKNQFHIVKSTKNNRTHIDIRKLREDERILEIARMTSGIDVNETAMQHARTLLKQ
jgi:DNA repair protein RecN (Recombination protein N)